VIEKSDRKAFLGHSLSLLDRSVTILTSLQHPHPHPHTHTHTTTHLPTYLPTYLPAYLPTYPLTSLYTYTHTHTHTCTHTHFPLPQTLLLLLYTHMHSSTYPAAGSQIVTQVNSASNLSRIMWQTAVQPGLSTVLNLLTRHTTGSTYEEVQ
jgi:hypothetical protein